jgi:hypothetical protein
VILFFLEFRRMRKIVHLKIVLALSLKNLLSKQVKRYQPRRDKVKKGTPYENMKNVEWALL